MLKTPSSAPTVKIEEEPLKMVCHARTRVPTPHGDVFLHVYKNNKDSKEHLAFVFDRQQLAFDPRKPSEDEYHRWIRSQSLDAEWKPGESDMERIVRGAYVGRLTAQQSQPSLPPRTCEAKDAVLVRIHSECFTGETIGSQRCDCGEQLDEAFRLISTCSAGRGVIVYLKQEGRGIGLLEKVRAYNLQDLGHDTVSANLLLGHGSDMRTYDMAAGILRDLGIQRVKLLTNNPDKVAQAEKEGIAVVERVPMVPRSWRQDSDRRARRDARRARQKRALHRAARADSASGEYSESRTSEETDSDIEADNMARQAGVGMIGSGTTDSSELSKYLRTKIERMGHMLDLPSDAFAPSTQPSTPEPFTGSDMPFPRRPHLSKPRSKKPVDLADSLTDLATDPEPITCDAGCADCSD